MTDVFQAKKYTLLILVVLFYRSHEVLMNLPKVTQIIHRSSE